MRPPATSALGEGRKGKRRKGSERGRPRRAHHRDSTQARRPTTPTRLKGTHRKQHIPRPITKDPRRAGSPSAARRLPAASPSSIAGKDEQGLTAGHGDIPRPCAHAGGCHQAVRGLPARHAAAGAATPVGEGEAVDQVRLGLCVG